MKTLITTLSLFLFAICQQAQGQDTNHLTILASVEVTENESRSFTQSAKEENREKNLQYTFSINGIYTKRKIQLIKDDLSTLLNEFDNLEGLSTLSIRIESSGKIAIVPDNEIDENSIDKIRTYLSTYDWDYLHEIMTVDILVNIHPQLSLNCPQGI